MSFTQPRAVFAEYPIMLYHINARRLRIRLPVVFDIFIQALSSKKAVSQQDGLHKAAALEVTGHTQSLADLECASRYRSHIRYTSYRPLRSPSNGRLPSSQAIDLSPDRRPEAHLSRAESLLDKLERSVVSCLLVISLRPDGISSDGEAVHAARKLSPRNAAPSCLQGLRNSRARESLHEELVRAQVLLQDLLDVVQRLLVHHSVVGSLEDGDGDGLDWLDVGVDEEGCGQSGSAGDCKDA